ncbi:MAG: dTDP-4-dehydrorhamnose 3,5-epimerase family protein [Actinomycetota bacterium]
MIEVAMDGVVVTEIARHADSRGSFAEIFRQSGRAARFVQANHSHSKRGVLRGFHYHVNQADLWYLVRGEIQVALVDLRDAKGGPATTTFLLDDQSPASVFIPRGVAHGYLALTDADVIYLVDQEYDGSDEHGIAWNDPSLAIEWQIADPILSDRDRNNPPLQWDSVPRFS